MFNQFLSSPTTHLVSEHFLPSSHCHSFLQGFLRLPLSCCTFSLNNHTLITISGSKKVGSSTIKKIITEAKAAQD
jgi:hypothetical protein